MGRKIGANKVVSGGKGECGPPPLLGLIKSQSPSMKKSKQMHGLNPNIFKVIGLNFSPQY